MSRLQLVSMIFVALAAPAWGVEVLIQIDADRAAKDPQDAILIARARSESDVGASVLQIPVSVPGEARIDLPAGRTWKLSLLSRTLWAAEAAVVPLQDRNLAPIRMRALPAGTIEGTVERTDAVEGPFERLLARFIEVGRTSDPNESPAEIRCPVAGTRWQCKVPAGTLDLRLRAKGYIARYFWGIEVGPGSASKLGHLALVPGSAVAGFVRTPTGEPARSAQVSLLAPSIADGDNGADPRSARPLRTVEANGRGFYQFGGIAAGAYAIEADFEGYATARMYPVTVTSGTSAEVWDLVLEPPLDLDVYLHPPADPFGSPWSLQLLEASANRSDHVAIDQAEASLSGTWSRAGFSPGDYVLVVKDLAGQQFATHVFELGPSTGAVQIEIDAVWVEGTVAMGDEPLAKSRLTFRSAAGGRFAIEVDEAGSFAGFVSGEGVWDVDVRADAPRVFRRLRDVEIRREPGDLIAHLAIELPAGAVAGTVRDESGSLRSDARVVVFAEAMVERPSLEEVDAEGRFELSGLSPGSYRLQAESQNERERSPMVSVSVGDGATSEAVTLVLAPLDLVRGRVVSDRGPAIGAQVLLMPDTSSTAAPPTTQVAVTDPNGSFAISVPRGTSSAQITVLPPGFALVAQRVAIRQGEEVTIFVDRFGGQLELTAARPIDWSRFETQPLLVRDGILVGASTLLAWANMQGARQADPARLVVPMMASGAYRACRIDPAAVFAPGGLDLGALDCVEGTVQPLGSLTLVLAAADRRNAATGR